MKLSSRGAARQDPAGAAHTGSATEGRVSRGLHPASMSKTVAIIGNPNTGKTTLFNALTGYRQRVGNYPGVTVERKTGRLRGVESAHAIELVDLPGTYSLSARTADEGVVLEALLGLQPGFPVPDVIVTVADASHPRRNLFLTAQVLELGRPVVVALNMADRAAARGILIDVPALSAQLGVPVIPVVAPRGQGVDELRAAIVAALDSPGSCCPPWFPPQLEEQLEALREWGRARTATGEAEPTRMEWLQALLDAEGYHEARLVKRYGAELEAELGQRRATLAPQGGDVAQIEAEARYAWIEQVLAQTISCPHRRRRSKSDIADRVLTHRVLGVLVFAVVLLVLFQVLYSWSGPLMGLIDAGMGAAAGWLGAVLPAGALHSLIVDGAIAGVGGVLIFLPQILLLFMFIAILEDTGYLARAAFIVDRSMGVLGLSGKSVIPLLSSFACAVPGVMATRTIEGRRDRLVTMMVAPLMSCSARLPVYVLLIAAFVPNMMVLGGWVKLQALVLLGVYLLGAVIAIPVAFLLKLTVLRGQAQPFLMELPGYRWPTVATVLHRMYEQGKEFCVRAGTIIFAVTILVWAAGYYPRPAVLAQQHEAARVQVEEAYQAELARIAREFDPAVTGEEVLQDFRIAPLLARGEEVRGGRAEQAGAAEAEIRAEAGETDPVVEAILGAQATRAEKLEQLRRAERGDYLRQSYLGRMGAFVEPVVRPLGWDWRIATATIASFPAREVVVASLGTIYNLGAETDETSVELRAKLRSVHGPDGRPVFNLAVALSLMVFFALCCQCAATLAAIKRESNSWRWPIFAFGYMTALAYVGALVTYQVARHFV